MKFLLEENNDMISNTLNQSINEEKEQMDNNKKEIDCIVFCGGKCGGSTLTKTLRNAGMVTSHYHTFDCDGLTGTDGIKLGKENLLNILNSSQKKIYILDIYRTPIERKISSFFQTIRHRVPDYKNRSCEELIDIFNSEYINTIAEWHSINMILDAYEIEHFKVFDFDRRYNIIEKGNLVFIKLLFNDIEKFDSILSDIFKKEIKLTPCNLSNNKHYYNIYKEFKEKYRVPKTYIENVLKNDKEFKIYNTIEEQKLYIEKWLGLSY